MDSIFALASAAGRGGVAVYRLSGPKAGEALRTLTGAELPKPRQAAFRAISHDGELIDQGLALWFPAPHSFTGEDVAELQLHGGRAVAQALTEALLALGLRPAEPGEFSRRAFMAGKLDLTQAEAIADLVEAETSAQRRQALRQMDGALYRLYEDWRDRLLRAQAHLEAEIDFSDEDLPGGLNAAARENLIDMAGEMARHLIDGHRGERLRDGLHIAILGSPNVGKSSLLNLIAGREAAIVSSQAGTTRDVIEVHLDLGGYPVVLADTAGLRETSEAIEEEGVRRARVKAEGADLKLVVLDASQEPDPAVLALVDEQTLVLLNKSDLSAGQGLRGHPVSAKTGEGLDELLAELTRRAAKTLEGSGAPALTRARHRLALEEAVENLHHALQATLPELVAEDVRLASRALGRITGRVDVEDMLDVIFREFCIGK